MNKIIKNIKTFFITHDTFTGIVAAIMIIAVIGGISYYIWHCQNCGWLPQRGWGIEYCGHCGHKF